MFAHPAPGFVTGDRFGSRPSFTAGGIKTSAMHGGQDFYPTPGKSRSVVAAADGVVVKHPYNASAGNAMCLWHAQLGRWTGYAHNATTLVGVGTKVTAGQPIAIAGSTGASTGVHLHFDVFTSLSGFVRIDPLPLIGSTPTKAAAPAVPTPSLEDDMVIFMAGKSPGFGILFAGGAVAKLNSRTEHDNLVRSGVQVVWLEQPTLDGLVRDLRGEFWTGGKR